MTSARFVFCIKVCECLERNPLRAIEVCHGLLRSIATSNHGAINASCGGH